MDTRIVTLLIDNEGAIKVPHALLTRETPEKRGAIEIYLNGDRPRKYLLKSLAEGELYLERVSTTAEEARPDPAIKHVEEQRQWIVSCGGDLAGYIKSYGSKHNPDYSRWPDGYYGMGGEAIYAADTAYLRELERRAGLPLAETR